MKHNEAQIKQLAKSVLKSIDFEYDQDKGIFKIWYNSVEDLLKEKEGLRNYEEYKKIVRAYWTAAFDLPKDFGARIATVYLHIYDDTGEPFEIQTWQATYAVKRNINGELELD